MADLIPLIAIQTIDWQASQRLFHGRGKAFQGFEHVTVDWFAPIVLITLYQEESADTVQNWADALSENIHAAKTILLQERFKKGAPVSLIKGEALFETFAFESGLRYQVSFGQAQNHGLFLDMKNGRNWVEQNASGKRVLNLFAYTCAFSVAAMAGGAEKVVNMDMSRAALTRGRENHRLNELDISKVVFEGVDIFKSFGRIKKHGPYDLLICDPPTFQKGSVDIARDYPKIIRRLESFMAPNALLMLCLNAPDLDDSFIENMMQQHAPACDFVQTLSAPEVFKESEAGKGLKIHIYQVAG